MNSEHPMTKEAFIKRFVDLCVRSGLTGIPKDEADQHVLFKSMLLTIGPAGTYTELDINEKLEYWINRISQIKKLDRNSLRRYLVDAGYLTRAKDGSAYLVAQSGPAVEFFEESINQLNLPEVIKTAQEDIARRKREYLEKSGKGSI